MPRGYGEQYWAEWARDFCEVAKLWPQRPGSAYAEMIGWDRQRVATAVGRLRKRGIIAPVADGFHLTPKGEALLNNLDVPATSVVAFNIRVMAKTKAEALAQVWDLEQQIESWDPKSGVPFRPRQESF